MPFANDTTASDLCLLSGLPRKAPGTKVRFLGCVSSYAPTTGVLTLGQPMTGTPTRVQALVSLDMVLDRISAEHIVAGAWINIIGRVERLDAQEQADPDKVRVQALLLWATGPLDFQAYETEVRGLLREDAGASAEAADQAMADG